MYILEGNIGAGKSTFLKLLSERVPHIQVGLEPLHNWQKSVSGQSLLTNFYQDPHRWAFSIETFAMMCRVKEHLHDQSFVGQLRLIERSIYSGHYCFTYNGYANGYISELEWQMYQAWFDFLIPNKCALPEGFIYLKTDPDIAYSRIKKRNRLAEKEITRAYLRQIHEHHEQFLLEKKNLVNGLEHVPVLVLDGNQEFEDDEQVFYNHAERIQEFMAQTAVLQKASRKHHTIQML